MVLVQINTQAKRLQTQPIPFAVSTIVRVIAFVISLENLILLRFLVNAQRIFLA